MDKVDVKNMRKTQVQVWQRHVTQRSKKSILIGIIFLIVFASALSGAGFHLYDSAYHNDLPLAKTGMKHLQTAEALFVGLERNPLAAQNVAQAQQEFAAALSDFTQIDNDLRPALSVASVFPVYGNRAHTAFHLIPLAIAFSQAGITSCDILNLLIARLHDPLNGQDHGITTVDLDFLGQRVHEIRDLLTASINEINQIQPSDDQFDPRIHTLLDKMRRSVPMLQGWLENIEKVLPGMSVLLGTDTPANYLVEVLDSTELRPGGGFIGNYGIVSFSDGQLITAHITDTDLLDQHFSSTGFSIPFPPEYRWFDIARGNLGLRDSNLDADFPASAKSAESLYMREGGDVPVQGVIAITPAFVQRALAITGPIAVPEYHEVVTEQNLIARIHYHQLSLADVRTDNTASPDGHSSLRKHFTALLAEHFLARVRQVASAKASQLLQLIIEALRLKDVQVYFNSPAVEALFHNAHLDAAIQPSPGDDLLVVDANISVNKANSLITSTLIDEVTIDTDGSAVHHATLRYAWTVPGESYGYPLYRDYVRVYVPGGSMLIAQDGWQPQGSSTAFDHKVWAGFFTLTHGQIRTITLTWKVPHAATFNGHGWHYQNLIQKQASTTWALHMQVSLPSCTRLVNTSGEMRAAGKQMATLDQLLTENTLTALDYAC